jgi:hypothetical protein
MSSDTILKGSESQENGVVDGSDVTTAAMMLSCNKSNNKIIRPNNHLMVDHTYTDYSIINEEDDVKILEEESPQLSKPCSRKEAEVREKLKGMTCGHGPLRKNAGGVTQPFPGKLMEVLSRSDLAEIIEWMPHGRAFLVKQAKAFASLVLRHYWAVAHHIVQNHLANAPCQQDLILQAKKKKCYPIQSDLIPQPINTPLSQKLMNNVM